MTPADNSTRHAPVRMEIPDVRTLLRHTTPRFLEGTLVPLVLFLVGLRFLGVWAGDDRRPRLGLQRDRRSAVAAPPGSGSARARRGDADPRARSSRSSRTRSSSTSCNRRSAPCSSPARSCCRCRSTSRSPAGSPPTSARCPSEVHSNAHVRRFFRHISLLWAFAQTMNAALTIWLLFSQSLSTFVVLRSVVSAGMTITAIAASTIWFKRSMRRNGIDVRLPAWRRVEA